MERFKQINAPPTFAGIMKMDLVGIKFLIVQFPTKSNLKIKYSLRQKSKKYGLQRNHSKNKIRTTKSN